MQTHCTLQNEVLCGWVVLSLIQSPTSLQFWVYPDGRTALQGQNEGKINLFISPDCCTMAETRAHSLSEIDLQGDASSKRYQFQRGPLLLGASMPLHGSACQVNDGWLGLKEKVPEKLRVGSPRLRKPVCWSRCKFSGRWACGC